MGYATSFWRTFNAPHKYWMGWLSGGARPLVHRFRPAATSRSRRSSCQSPPYPQAVRNRSRPPVNAYYVGYRVSMGYDASLVGFTSYPPGKVQVHRMDSAGLQLPGGGAWGWWYFVD